MPHKKRGKKGNKEKKFHSIFFTYNIKKEYRKKYYKIMNIFTIYKKKTVISKGIKVECKSNLFKKNEESSTFLSILNKTKTLKDKITKK